MTTPLLVDIDDVKDQLEIDDQSHDSIIEGYLEVATELIEGQVGPVVPRSYTETVTLSPTIVLSRAPVISVEALTPVYPEDTAFYNSGYTYNVADYLLDPAKGILRRIPKYGYAGNYGGVSYGYGFSGLITVTYTAGRAVIPASLKQAAILFARELLQAERGSVTPVNAMGAPAEDAPMPSTGIPAIVYELLTPYLKAGRPGRGIA